MNQLTGRKTGQVAILTDSVFTVNGIQCNGFKVDIETMQLTPTYNGVKADSDIPLKPLANTVEYALLLLRAESGQEAAEASFKAVF